MNNQKAVEMLKIFIVVNNRVSIFSSHSSHLYDMLELFLDNVCE